MTSAEVSHSLYRARLLMDLAGENPFKVKAYTTAIKVVESLGEKLADYVADGRLTGLPGIGKGMAEKITTLVKTGELPELADLEKKVPVGLLELMKVDGLGVKKVRVLWKELGITTPGELEYACNENRLLELPGFGKRSQDKILHSLAQLARHAGWKLLPEALKESSLILEYLLEDENITRAEVSGSLRRNVETINTIPVIAQSEFPGSVITRFLDYANKAGVIKKTDSTALIKLSSGLTASLTVTRENEYPMTLFRTTGSELSMNRFTYSAEQAGITVTETGLLKGGETILLKDEEDIYSAVGLPYKPPELREKESGPFDPDKPLLKKDDIAGIFHCHTTYSDGGATLEEMAKACRDLGYSYLGVTDHSRSAYYAGGLSIDALALQSDEIDRLNEELTGFTIFKGVESDILPDGSLDYPEPVLDKLDFVIASVHAGFQGGDMTPRIVTAMENRYTTMLGHPTGRLLLTREGYKVDMEAIIEAGAANGVVIELNCNPHRLDIDWRHISRAIKAGVKISINPDAHRIAGLAHVSHGVMMARKGGALPENVVNTMGVEEVTRFLKESKEV